jgi:hypothetical protein
MEYRVLQKARIAGYSSYINGPITKSTKYGALASREQKLSSLEFVLLVIGEKSLLNAVSAIILLA